MRRKPSRDAGDCEPFSAPASSRVSVPLPPELASEAQWVLPGVGLVAPAGGHAGASSLLLDEGGDVLLVDAGLAPAQRRRLAPHVDVCLLTHCHVAHAHGARDFREVWAPRAESNALQGADDYLSTFGVSRRDRDLVSSGLRRAGYEPSPVHKTFRPGGILKLEQHEWHVLGAPGHSPGMVALLEPDRHVLFAADLDGEGPPWYGYPTSDPSELERTATTLAEVPVAVYLSSHGPPRRRGIKPMLRGMVDTIHDRDRIVLQKLDAPHTLDELADLGLFLGKTTDPLQRYHERVMVEKHLLRLLEKDFAAARQDGRFMRVA
jgi:glyoxylase-like metal-dependent hydrolase (beta-lactamase superfamily II)